MWGQNRWAVDVSGQSVRERFMRRFVGMEKYSRWVAWLVVSSYIAQVVVGIYLGNYLLSLDLSVWTVSAMVLVAVLIGTRLRGINNIVHECSHSSFAAKREDNVTLGRLCSSLLTGCFKTYKEDHLSHHSHLGDYAHDHEFAVLEKFKLHEEVTWKKVAHLFFAPLLGRHLTTYSGVNLSSADGWHWYGVKVLFLSLIVHMTIVAPLTAIFFIILPWFFIFPTLNFWTDCLDHAGICGESDELKASRNVLAPGLIRYVFFPRNDCYHLVHHLFPQIPARHLHKAHAELCKDPEYGDEPVATLPTFRTRSASKSFGGATA